MHLFTSNLIQAVVFSCNKGEINQQEQAFQALSVKAQESFDGDIRAEQELTEH